VRSVLLGCARLAKASQEHQPGRRPDPRETPVGPPPSPPPPHRPTLHRQPWHPRHL